MRENNMLWRHSWIGLNGIAYNLAGESLLDCEV